MSSSIRRTECLIVKIYFILPYTGSFLKKILNLRLFLYYFVSSLVPHIVLVYLRVNPHFLPPSLSLSLSLSLSAISLCVSDIDKKGKVNKFPEISNKQKLKIEIGWETSGGVVMRRVCTWLLCV